MCPTNTDTRPGLVSVYGRLFPGLGRNHPLNGTLPDFRDRPSSDLSDSTIVKNLPLLVSRLSKIVLKLREREMYLAIIFPVFIVKQAFLLYAIWVTTQCILQSAILLLG